MSWLIDWIWSSDQVTSIRYPKGMPITITKWAITTIQLVTTPSSLKSILKTLFLNLPPMFLFKWTLFQVFWNSYNSFSISSTFEARNMSKYNSSNARDKESLVENCTKFINFCWSDNIYLKYIWDFLFFAVLIVSSS